MVHHKHYPNLGSDTSTMQNFCASSSGVISPGQPVVGYLHPLVFGMEMALLPSLQYIYSSVFTYLQFVRSKFEQIHFFVQWHDGCEVGRAGGTIAWGPRESLLADCERGRPSVPQKLWDVLRSGFSPRSARTSLLLSTFCDSKEK